ncbi:MAG TPA: hypothetical protein VEI97_04690, partial [bacterium]|nr:hypothetical protein [bacterium]
MTTPRTPAAGLLILIPLLAGCGGGGGTTPNPRPNVAAVTPSGVAGVAGSTVTFRATVNNSPTSWTWTFDTGVEPANSTAP